MRGRRSKSSKISESARVTMSGLLAKHFKPKVAKAGTETVDEYLARGGKVEKLPGIGEAPFRRTKA